MNKKAITILGAIFLLIVGTLGFLIYQRRANNTVVTAPPPPPVQVLPPPPADPLPPPVEILPPPPPTASGGAVVLTDTEAVSPVLFYQGNGVSYFNSQGQLFQQDLTVSATGVSLSNIRELSVPLKAGLKRVLWPDAGNNYIVEFETAGKKSWSVYVADRGEYVDLPEQVVSINWMPGGDKILYVWVDSSGVATLNVANPDNTGYQVVTDFWEPENDISISPDSKTVLFWQTQNKESPNPINQVTADGKVFKSVVKEGYNLGGVWSPDSRKFLFLQLDPTTQSYQLWVANTFSGEIRNLNVYTSLDKVVWTADSQAVFAAAPKLSTGLVTESGDTFFKINLATGDSTEVNPNMSVNAVDLFLTSAQDNLLFRNLQDNKLYYLPVSRR